MKTIVFDLETIPDRALWSPPVAEPFDPAVCEKGCGRRVDDWTKFATLPREEQKCPKMTRGTCRPGKPPANGNGNDFPPIHAHQIIVLGFAVLEDNKTTFLGAATASDAEQERELLEGASDFFASADQFVTWGGHTFDMPVLEMRSLRHCTPQPWYDDDARNRYKIRHIDMCTFLDWRDKLNLDTMSRLIGLPGKSMGNGETFDGSQVAEAFGNGRISDIAQYCMRDVVQTAALWLRYQRVRGKLSGDAYKEAIHALINGQARKQPSMADQTVFAVDWPTLEGI